MKGFEKIYHLDPEGICGLADDLGEYLEKNDIEKREVFRLRFVIEELLVRVVDDREKKIGNTADPGVARKKAAAIRFF